ncbi:uncharacterized protein TNCV_2670611 [Trichonephila clavipes]|nr:uncharacterized protein TNCV_2670611 [Trichonephila clavipes]
METVQNSSKLQSGGTETQKRKTQAKVFSEANCDAVGTGFKSRRRHGCLFLYSASVDGGTLNSSVAASPFVRLVEGKAKFVVLDHPESVLPQNWGGTEPNRTVTCMVLKAKANDRRKNLALHCDEFHGP